MEGVEKLKPGWVGEPGVFLEANVVKDHNNRWKMYGPWDGCCCFEESELFMMEMEREMYDV